VSSILPDHTPSNIHDCMICLDPLPLPSDIVDPREVIVLGCFKHVAHVSCQKAWTTGEYRCAICREINQLFKRKKVFNAFLNCTVRLRPELSYAPLDKAKTPAVPVNATFLTWFPGP
jgi:hypothetical protein